MFLKNLVDRHNYGGANNVSLARTLAACVDAQGIYIVSNEALRLQLERDFMDTLGRFRRIYTMEDVRIGNTPKAICPVFWDSSVVLALEDQLHEEVKRTTDSMMNKPLTVVKLGNKDRKPTAADLETWKEVFEAAQHDKDFKVMSYDGVQIERIYPEKQESKISVTIGGKCRDCLDGYHGEHNPHPMAPDGYILAYDGVKMNWANTEETKESKKSQMNVKLTETDVIDIKQINDDFFEGEATNSMLGRVLLRKGIFFYKKLREKF